MHTIVSSMAGPLLECLIALKTGNSRTRLKQLLSHGAILINGHTAARHDEPISVGDRISFGRGGITRQGPTGGIQILHEDSSVIVIDKPSGLLTVATDNEKDRTAYRYLNDYLKGEGRVFIVHRLDRDTSGLVVFAKTEAAKEFLQKHWGETEKRYWAVVRGVPARKIGRIEGNLTENTAFRVYDGRKTEESKFAITCYEVKKSTRHSALLDVTIETGRKHQIRVQLAEIGHPVLGDDKYGEREPKKQGRGGDKARLALHARLLTFPHPETGKKTTFESPLPIALAKLV